MEENTPLTQELDVVAGGQHSNWNDIITSPLLPFHVHQLEKPGPAGTTPSPPTPIRTHMHTHERTRARPRTAKGPAEAHLRNCRCRRDTARRRRRRALRKSPAASRRPPRRRWGRTGYRSTISPPPPPDAWTPSSVIWSAVSLAPELDLDLSGRHGDDAQDTNNSWSDSSISSFHYRISSSAPSAWPGNRDSLTLWVHRAYLVWCSFVLKAPFLSSSPRYEISPSVAYMHTQEDAGKNAMTNSGAGQPSISEALYRPTPNFLSLQAAWL